MANNRAYLVKNNQQFIAIAPVTTATASVSSKLVEQLKNDGWEIVARQRFFWLRVLYSLKQLKCLTSPPKQKG